MPLTNRACMVGVLYLERGELRNPGRWMSESGGGGNVAKSARHQVTRCLTFIILEDISIFSKTSEIYICQDEVLKATTPKM